MRCSCSKHWAGNKRTIYPVFNPGFGTHSLSFVLCFSSFNRAELLLYTRDNFYQTKMEESEKRRERLRAMRNEACDAGVSNKGGSECHKLSNPLMESGSTPNVQISSPGTPRFDYYTDPMAAFSNNNRMRNGSSYQNSPNYFNSRPTSRNPEMAPSPAHQVQPTYSPDHRINQLPSLYYSSGPMRPQTTPLPAHHVRFPTYSLDPRMNQQPQSSFNSSPAHHVQPPYSTNPRMGQQPRGSYYNLGPRNPSIMSPYSPFPPEGQSGHFHVQGPYQSSYANTHSPSSRGNRPIASSKYGGISPNSGRGRGRSGFGQGGNRGGSGSHGSVYYNKSMVEDPWKNLVPSIWKIEVNSVKGFNSTSNSTFSRSDPSGSKKARVSEAVEESSSQPTLAEYLASVFNEAVGGRGNNE